MKLESVLLMMFENFFGYYFFRRKREFSAIFGKSADILVLLYPGMKSAFGNLLFELAVQFFSGGIEFVAGIVICDAVQDHFGRIGFMRHRRR